MSSSTDTSTQAPPPLPVNPNWSASFKKAFEQWEAENAQYGADYANLQKMIETMLHEMSTGHTQQAFMLAQMNVMPATMQVQGDSMGQLAASMNVASALQESMTNAQNDANYGKSINSAEAAAFVKNLQQLESEVKVAQQQNLMGSSTANNILTAINQISETFGAKNASELNPIDVEMNINLWYTDLTKTCPNGKTGQQNIQDLQTGMTQTTNSISSQSQGLQAEEQFTANTFTQFMNVVKDMYKAAQSQGLAMVQNQKG